MTSLHKNRIWEIVDKPMNKKLICCKRTFKKKDGILEVEKPMYKERIVAKGFLRNEAMDFTEIFSPVVKQISIRVVLSMMTVRIYLEFVLD